MVRTIRTLPYAGPKLLPEDWSGPDYDPWTSAIEIAASQNMITLNDDFSGRVLASSRGVQSFGLHALVDALSRTGAITPEEHSDALARLVAAGSFMAPLEELGLKRLGAAQDAPEVAATTASCLSGADGWQDPTKALEVLVSSVDRCLVVGDVNAASDALALSLVGASEYALLAGLDPARFASQVTAAVLASMSAYDADVVARVVLAHAWLLSDWFDEQGQSPARLAETVFGTLVKGGADRGEASTATLQLLAGLPDADRRLAAGSILSPTVDRPEPPIAREVQRHLAVQRQ